MRRRHAERVPRLWRVARRYCRALKVRPNVAGICLVGSLASGSEDESSDVDLVVIVESFAIEAEVAAAPAVASSVGNIMVDGAVFGPRSYSTVMSFGERLVKVDLDFLPMSDLSRAVADSFARRVYLYHHKIVYDRDGDVGKEISRALEPALVTHHEIDAIGFSMGALSALRMIRRGEYFEACDILNHMRDPYLTTLLCRIADVPFENCRRLERKVPRETLAALRRTVARPNRRDLLLALKETVALFESSCHLTELSFPCGVVQLLDEISTQAGLEICCSRSRKQE